MGILRFNYRSQSLGHYVDITVALPTERYTYYAPGIQKGDNIDVSKDPTIGTYSPDMKFQTVYLVHGGGDDDSLPYRFTNVERYAIENDVMVVTPDIANSFGIDTRYHVKYQTFLCEELPVVIQSLFPSSPKREDNFIVGFAMGGNTALGAAIMHPENYAMCIDMSGGIGLTLNTDTLIDELNSDHFKSFFPLYNSAFGEADSLRHSDLDLYDYAKKNMEEGRDVCPIKIICGSKEFIRARVEDDVRILKELGYPCDYELAEGFDHDFDMWDVYLKKALCEILPLKREHAPRRK